MGSYATLYIGGNEIYSEKNEVSQFLMTLFQASERRILRGTVREIAPDQLDEDGTNAEEKIGILKYETTVGALKDRLDLMGFSSQFIGKEFERVRCERVSAPPDDIFYESPHRELLEATDKLERRVFHELTLSKWLRMFEKLWKEDQALLSTGRLPEPPIDAPFDDLLVWYMREHTYDMPYGFISYDPRVFLRLACDFFPSHTPAVYDLTELVSSLYDDNPEEVASLAEEHLDGGYAT
ncbi:MAG: HEPN/Toprim-associated domain-containing protein, partial [Nitrospiraceae bacterium]